MLELWMLLIHRSLQWPVAFVFHCQYRAEIAAGNKPIAAIKAVITTGRTLEITPSQIASWKCIFFIEVFSENANEDYAILNTYAKQCNESNACADAEIHTGYMQCKYTANQCKGHI